MPSKHKHFAARVSRPLVIWLIAACALCQELPPAHVSIRIIDSLTGKAIENASVTVAPESPWSSFETKRTSATAEVEFNLVKERSYRISAMAGGYASDLGTFVKAGPDETITLTLAPLGSFSGTVTDRETGAPLQGVGVGARQLRYLHGRRQALVASAEATTDKAGHFVLSNLRPGDYLIETGSLKVPARAGSKPTAYRTSYWPGGGYDDAAGPIRLVAGSEASLGVLALRADKLYRATIIPTGPFCTPGETYHLQLSQPNRFSDATVRAEATAACDEAATFDAVSPGNYRIRVVSSNERFPESLGYGTLHITDEDRTERVVIARPIIVRGSIRGVEANPNATPEAQPPVQIKVNLWPHPDDDHQAVASLPVGTSSTVHEDGTFESRVYAPATGRVRVDVFGLPQGFYVSEVDADRRRFAGNEIELVPGQATSEIDVRVERSAKLTGSVEECKCSARILVIPAPASVADGYPFGVVEAAAVNGRFAFNRLPPGRYSIVAVATPSGFFDDRLDEPGRLLSLAARAKIVEVDANTPTDISVSLSDY